jgi:proline dehydrogenase
MTTLRVELLTTPGCPHASEAEARLRTVADELGVVLRLQRLVIDDIDEAASFGFTGSPTLRVEGRDVAPPGRGAEAALACRLYAREDGPPAPVPAIETLRRALDEALLARRRPGRLRRMTEVPAHAMRGTLLAASREPGIEAAIRRLPAGRSLVRRFVAGEDLTTALDAIDDVTSAGFLTTVDVLGESVSDEAAAATAAARYLELLGALGARGLEANVSLKLTQMGLGVDPAVARSNLDTVAAAAARQGGFVRVDMEDSSRTQVTLDIAREAFAGHGNVGVVIQSYLRRSAGDVEDLVREGIRVRLCKGAYDEPGHLAYRTRREVDESFAQLAERLLEAGSYPALATHDERLVDAAIAFAARRGIGSERFEFQMLYGIRRELQERLLADGYRVRLYVPYGTQWYPYYMRRLAERPANVLFILRNILRPGG